MDQEGQRQLLDASDRGDAVKVAHLLSSGANVNSHEAGVSMLSSLSLYSALLILYLSVSSHTFARLKLERTRSCCEASA